MRQLLAANDSSVSAGTSTSYFLWAHFRAVGAPSIVPVAGPSRSASWFSVSRTRRPGCGGFGVPPRAPLPPAPWSGRCPKICFPLITTWGVRRGSSTRTLGLSRNASSWNRRGFISRSTGSRSSTLVMSCYGNSTTRFESYGDDKSRCRLPKKKRTTTTRQTLGTPRFLEM
jgi:hypothetical protein